MIPSPQLEDFIKGWEWCELKPYRDQAGKWTVGWGHLMKPSDDKTMTITQDEADALFDMELLATAHLLDQVMIQPPKQQQYDAVISLVYNIGIGAFQVSTLRSLMNNGCYKVAAGEFRKWCKVTINGVKQTSNGLLKRRLAETDIFLNGNYGGRP